MKLLYVSSCHPTLEYNDLMLFSELGIDWFSTGIYIRPKTPHAITSLPPRGIIDRANKEKKFKLFRKDNPSYFSRLRNLYRPRIKLSKELVDGFDVIVCNSFSHYVLDNWDTIKDKIVIWRTYGDQTPQIELEMNRLVNQGLIPLRGSEKEFLVENSCGGRVIRCYVDDSIYSKWIGEEESVLSFSNYFKGRRKQVIGAKYVELREKLERKGIHFKLFGDYVSHKKDPLVTGKLNTNDQIEEYRKNRVYFAIHSHPATITYSFIEAWISGIPVVAFGEEIGSSMWRGLPCYYEVPELVDNTINGFYSDNLEELASYILALLDDFELAKNVSLLGREKAIKLFGKEVIKLEWKEFFNELGFTL